MGQLEKNEKVQKKNIINYYYNPRCIGCELTVNSPHLNLICQNVLKN